MVVWIRVVRKTFRKKLYFSRAWITRVKIMD
jgi:hypothetical protein